MRWNREFEVDLQIAKCLHVSTENSTKNQNALYIANCFGLGCRPTGSRGGGLNPMNPPLGSATEYILEPNYDGIMGGPSPLMEKK